MRRLQCFWFLFVGFGMGLDTAALATGRDTLWFGGLLAVAAISATLKVFVP